MGMSNIQKKNDGPKPTPKNKGELRGVCNRSACLSPNNVECKSLPK